MPNLEEINLQIMNVNGGKRADFVSLVKHLPDILNSTEHIEKILEGSIGDDLVLVIATEQRLVFIAATIFGKNLRLADLLYENIRLIQPQISRTFWSGSEGKLRILDSQLKETIITGIYKYDVEAFGEFVNTKIIVQN